MSTGTTAMRNAEGSMTPGSMTQCGMQNAEQRTTNNGQPTAVPNGLIGQVEQMRCGNSACDSAVGHDCVASNIDIATGVRTVRIYCEHCQRLYQGRYQLRGGIWELIGEIEHVTDRRRITGMLARIDLRRGNVQRVA